MAEECRRDILRCHTAPIVNDAHVGRSATLDLHSDVRCAGINGVFHQFLDDRGRPFDDFSGSDQLRNFLLQYGNMRHDKHLLSKRHPPQFR